MSEDAAEAQQWRRPAFHIESTPTSGRSERRQVATTNGECGIVTPEAPPDTQLEHEELLAVGSDLETVNVDAGSSSTAEREGLEQTDGEYDGSTETPKLDASNGAEGAAIETFSTEAQEAAIASTAKPKWNRKLVVRSLMVLVLVGIVAGVSVAVVLVTSDKGRENDGPSPGSSPPSNQTPENNQYFRDIRNLLVPSSLWTDPTSPQMRAVEWMAYTDVSVRLLDDQPLLEQRYALLVVYFATGGENWDSVWQFKPGVHECDWSFVSCQEESSVSGFQVGSGFVAGVLPSEIGMLTQLTVLHVKNNRLKGPLPDELYDLTRLERLVLSNNLFSSTLSTKIGDLIQLERLDIGATFLAGILPTTFVRLSSLKFFDCSNSFVEGNIFDRVLPLTNLEALYISSTDLTGDFPTEIGQLSRLSEIRALRTGISGSLPSEIGTLPLVALDIYDTRMGGPIPESLGQLAPTLRILVLGTFFTSTIPTTLGLLTRLDSLLLATNGLGGTIPTEFGNLALLRDLLLHSNGLTGAVPSELGMLTRLGRLNIADNSLSGTMPDEVCNLKDDFALDILLANVCRGQDLPVIMDVTCPCCTSCFG